MSRRREEGPTSDPVVQGKLRSREKAQARQVASDLRVIMGMPAGRRFMYDLIFERCGLMNLYPVNDSGVYRHEGARSVGFQIAAALQQEVGELYILMIKEHVEDLANEKKLRDAALTPTSSESGDDLS